MAASEHVDCFYGMGVSTKLWGLRKHLEGKDFETNFLLLLFLVWFGFGVKGRGKVKLHVSFEISTNVL